MGEGAIIYFCGLKGMMPGINDMLERVATSKGIEWDTFQKGLKKNGQYHVEVYWGAPRGEKPATPGARAATSRSAPIHILSPAHSLGERGARSGAPAAGGIGGAFLSETLNLISQ